MQLHESAMPSNDAKDTIGFERLRCLVAAVQCGSLAAAARRMGLSQPALTYQIRALEQLVGFRVLERHARGVDLTARGRRLYDEAAQLNEHMKRFDALAHSLRVGSATDELRIAMLPWWAEHLVGQLVSGLRAALPTTRLSIIEASNSQGQALLDSGKVDALVTDDVRGLSNEIALVTDALCLVTAEDIGPFVSLAEAARGPLVLPGATDPLREHLDDIAGPLGLTLNVALQAEGLHAMRSAVHAGIGNLLAPWLVACPKLGDARLFPAIIVQPEIYRPVVLRYGRRMGARNAGILAALLRPAYETAAGERPVQRSAAPALQPAL